MHMRERWKRGKDRPEALDAGRGEASQPWENGLLQRRKHTEKRAEVSRWRKKQYVTHIDEFIRNKHLKVFLTHLLGMILIKRKFLLRWFKSYNANKVRFVFPVVFIPGSCEFHPSPWKFLKVLLSGRHKEVGVQISTLLYYISQVIWVSKYRWSI